jgi:hypothetical protein
MACCHDFKGLCIFPIAIGWTGTIHIVRHSFDWPGTDELIVNYFVVWQGKKLCADMHCGKRSSES